MAEYRVGCCVSGHGFGHAARTLAVMEKLAGLADVRFTVACSLPEWFFRASFAGPFSYIRLQTDVGLVQHSSLHEDLPATLRELRKFYPLRPGVTPALTTVFEGCDLVLCDIAPAGIIAARSLGIPSVLLENFTWDWIYKGYIDSHPELETFCGYFQNLFSRADYHIRAMPFCGPFSGDLQAGPLARQRRCPKEDIRRRLSIEPLQRMVLLSMGGGGFGNMSLDLPDDGESVYVIAGAEINGPHIRGLGKNHDFFHPDLVAASDAVIGKIGYSTIAEVYQAGVPFGYVGRQHFRETGPLAGFIRLEMAGLEITEQELANGGLPARLPELYGMSVPERRHPDGAGQCARFLASLLQQAGTG